MRGGVRPVPVSSSVKLRNSLGLYFTEPGDNTGDVLSEMSGGVCPVVSGALSGDMLPPAPVIVPLSLTAVALVLLLVAVLLLATLLFAVLAVLLLFVALPVFCAATEPALSAVRPGMAPSAVGTAYICCAVLFIAALLIVALLILTLFRDCSGVAPVSGCGAKNAKLEPGVTKYE